MSVSNGASYVREVWLTVPPGYKGAEDRSVYELIDIEILSGLRNVSLLSGPSS